MSFNSTVFLGFFIIVYTAYLLSMRKVRAQNAMLLVASWVFYGYWDWRFLSLLILSTCVDFIVGLAIQNSENPRSRKVFIVLSIAANLCTLGFFKYFNFFADSFATLLTAFGLQPNYVALNITLPVGISFYTFQSMSYTIDVYRRQLTAVRNFVDLALYISFFPQLVAGPIERAVNLLPRVVSPRTIKIHQVNSGICLILWGYFKKVAIADNLGVIADKVFGNYSTYQGMDLLLGIVAFTVQIYCDFSGYSDIARGLAKLMGFELMVNFRFPYFALNPSDFWSRWHISLSTWLRDYLYIPLGGNRNGRANTYKNLLLTMLLGGLWHGAAWNYVLWGAFHGTILVLYRVVEDAASSVNLAKWRSGPMPKTVQRMLMLGLVMISWVLFRSRSVDQIVYMLSNINLAVSSDTLYFVKDIVFFTLFLVPVEMHQYRREMHQYKRDDTLTDLMMRPSGRVISYALLIVGILVFRLDAGTEFIYFQF